ncbi:UDP-N-acetylglucosamine 4,6-dehydratase [Psychrobium sp. nBUS_13]|uniref:UDP-N-acetylglucosamine 4,6-dehydratase n=1 Tax=Psychrobium sp. nBUS_13 TaxID=3395319 RepID=UPI003EB91CDB
MNSIFSLIDREHHLFSNDISQHEATLQRIIRDSKFLVLGGAGTIGQAVSKELFSRQPKKLHIVDINENNLAELVRDVRSSYGYINGEFKTFCLDIGTKTYDAFYENDGEYDYILNLSALKHVRSERDPYTLMRLIDVNIMNTQKTLQKAIDSKVKKYFCVSTDKATNPVNMMGASKRIMELYLNRASAHINISTARFANVLCSDGSLGHSFSQRLAKGQPLVAPSDIYRYFVTPKEAGELCLLSCLLGENRDIFFPTLDEDDHLQSFKDIAIKFLSQHQLTPLICDTEDQARTAALKLPINNQWPCFFTQSTTTGEKDKEEFFTETEFVDYQRFNTIGIIKNQIQQDHATLDCFNETIIRLQREGIWDKQQIVDAFVSLLPNFTHCELNKFLDDKM